VTQLDKAHGERSHEWPLIVEDGHTLLFSVNANTSGFDEEGVSLLTLGTGARQTVRTGGDAVGFTDGRELLFVRDYSLMSASYDSTHHALASEAREMVANVRRGSGSTAVLSSSGTLVYVPSPDLKRRSLVWIAPDGTQTDANFGRRQFRSVSLSLDGRRVAVAAVDPEGTALYVGDTSGGTLTPVATRQGRTWEMPWNPDGRSFAGGDVRTGRLLRFSVLGAGAGEPLLADGTRNLPEQWTPDGRGLIFTRVETGTGRISICLLSFDTSPAKWSVIVDGGQGTARGASLSPDGHWLAYESNESERSEIYVQAYPSQAPRLQVSREGGTKARWAKDSNQVYFITGGTTLMVTKVTTHPELRSEAPRTIVNEPLLVQDGAPAKDYDIAPDGRILALKEDDSARFDYIVVVQNWLSETRALLSTPRK
jgi:dipeptidyl aminopeptidase/acylaminoacyl peptidase